MSPNLRSCSHEHSSNRQYHLLKLHENTATELDKKVSTRWLTSQTLSTNKTYAAPVHWRFYNSRLGEKKIQEWLLQQHLPWHSISAAHNEDSSWPRRSVFSPNSAFKGCKTCPQQCIIHGFNSANLIGNKCPNLSAT